MPLIRGASQHWNGVALRPVRPGQCALRLWPDALTGAVCRAAHGAGIRGAQAEHRHTGQRGAPCQVRSGAGAWASGSLDADIWSAIGACGSDACHGLTHWLAPCVPSLTAWWSMPPRANRAAHAATWRAVSQPRESRGWKRLAVSRAQLRVVRSERWTTENRRYSTLDGSWGFMIERMPALTSSK
jgi:hypothetical protein